MNSLHVIGATAMLTMGFAGVAAAQDQALPAERSDRGSCEAVKWNAEMQRAHPTLIGACREVIVVDGQTWARFDARFARLEPDGRVIFSVRDQSDRTIEEVRLMPAQGQVAYIDDRATPFAQLRSTDAISLYVPEGQYGFATKPGVPKDQLAAVVPATDTPARAPATRPGQAAGSAQMAGQQTQMSGQQGQTSQLTAQQESRTTSQQTPMSAQQQTSEQARLTAQQESRTSSQQTPMVAQQQQRRSELPDMLPTTAGPLPLIALGGLLSLLGGLGLTLRRRR